MTASTIATDWPRQTNINGGETASAQVIRRHGHCPNVAGLNASKCLLGQGLPSQLRWHHDRWTSDSRRLAATPKSAESGHFRTLRLPFSLRQRLCNFAGVLNEKLRHGAECAVLQSDNSDWHAGMLQFNGQDLDLRTLGKSQYGCRDNRKKASGRQ